ncbi:MAG TPA: short chain dehydrogenase, partial [Aquabacterium sp.]|nr:short chain dehydrogenase [Aquabacterium sp.]
MKDGYIDFANSAMGAKLVNALGLPKPLPLERYKAGDPVIKGSVLVGGSADAQLLESLASVFKSIGAQTVAHDRLPQWVAVANKAGLTTGRWGTNWQPGDKVKA